MPDKFIIQGQKKLDGEIKVKGAKNAALKFFAAAILTDKQWRFSNVPCIGDVLRMTELLSGLGVKVSRISDEEYLVQAEKVGNVLPPELTRKLRASIVLTGPILARQGSVVFSHPGGCLIGQRPIDIFLDGFEAMGAEIKQDKDKFHLTAGKLKGAKFFFPKVSVTATETLMLAGVLAEGKTILKNTACEPEIPALAEFLNRCGAKIKGAGTSNIEIAGVEGLNSGEAKIIPDRIEAGTFAILAAATKSGLKITHCRPEHSEALLVMLQKAGVKLEAGEDSIRVYPGAAIKSVDIQTREYPGFATDFQAPFSVLLTQAQGSSLIHETVHNGRLFYSDILNQMGADIIMCDPHRILVRGPSKLYGRRIASPDIRAGIALLIAAMTAEGETVIQNIEQIDRGYEKIEERLQNIGADIKRAAE